MRFRIDLKIFILLVLFFLTSQIHIYATVMIFAIIHELGHLVAGLLVGMKPEKIELNPFGLSIGFKLKPEDYNHKIKKGNLLTLKEIIVASAGPITNIIIIFIILSLNMPIFEQLIIIYSNILLILFNILPIYPLDGGRIVKGILHINFGKKIATKYIRNISFTVAIIITAIASIAILYLQNIAIILIIGFLWVIIIKEEKTYLMQEKMYKIIDENSKKS